jgi:iron complex outermembrane receptor protein
MSELINIRDNRTTIRWKLLAGVSALALTAYVSAGSAAHADDAGKPEVWIELGGQLSRLDDGQETFAPPLMTVRPSMFSPSQPFEKPPLYSIDETGKISFQPDGSDWILSASIRYGRSASKRNVHQQTFPISTVTRYSFSGYHFTRHGPPQAAKFADTNVTNSESHDILDFQAGKDVGLGMFGGKEGSSVISVGIRFAQFASKSNIALKSDPDWHFVFRYGDYPSLGIYHLRFIVNQPYHSNAASVSATRNFHGIGPSLSWNVSAPFVGNSKGGELTFDWGLNAAILFGRQKVKTHHQTTGRYSTRSPTAYESRHSTYQGPATPDHARVKTVIVPNVGGFAGLSFHVENFKVSAGYRADMFFSAMDGGIDTRKNENVGFYGPFASVSVGLGG